MAEFTQIWWWWIFQHSIAQVWSQSIIIVKKWGLCTYSRFATGGFKGGVGPSHLVWHTSGFLQFQEQRTRPGWRPPSQLKKSRSTLRQGSCWKELKKTAFSRFCVKFKANLFIQKSNWIELRYWVDLAWPGVGRGTAIGAVVCVHCYANMVEWFWIPNDVIIDPLNCPSLNATGRTWGEGTKKELKQLTGLLVEKRWQMWYMSPPLMQSHFMPFHIFIARVLQALCTKV